MIANIIKKLYHQRFFTFFFPTTVSCLQKELADCDSVLDLGCGPDSPIQYCSNISHSVGVEAYLPYLESSQRKKIHSKYIFKNALKLDFPEKSFDAVVMVEVLEHLTKEDGLKLITLSQKWAAKKVIITTPNGFVRQSSLDGNKLQKHLSGWTVGSLKKLSFGVHGLSGLKVLRQEASNSSMGDDLTVSIRFKPKILWFIIATLSQSFTYYFPKTAFELFCVYLKK